MENFRFAGCLLLLLLSPFSLAGKLYKWTDENGNVYFTDRPQNQDAEALTLSPTNTMDSNKESYRRLQDTLAEKRRLVSTPKRSAKHRGTGKVIHIECKGRSVRDRQRSSEEVAMQIDAQSLMRSRGTLKVDCD